MCNESFDASELVRIEHINSLSGNALSTFPHRSEQAIFGFRFEMLPDWLNAPDVMGQSDVDKLAEFNCETAPAAEIDSVLLVDAAANFECTLEQHMHAGDHVIFVGKIVASHINSKAKKRLYTTAPGHKLGPVS